MGAGASVSWSRHFWICEPSGRSRSSAGCSFCTCTAKTDDAFRQAVDDLLERYIGSADHRQMMARYGFTNAEIDLLAG